jgi:tetratricopeptide (TPR) repeat protein
MREAMSQRHQMRGNYFLQRGLHGTAIECYRLALEWAPDNAQIWYGLGFTYAQAGEPREALKAWLQAKEILPTMPGVDLAIGSILLDSGNPAEAAPYLLEAAEVHKDAEAIQLLKRIESGGTTTNESRNP